MFILKNGITKNESIFIVEQTHIEHFNRIATDIRVYEDLIKEYPVDIPNKWPVTFNFFCVFFLEDHEGIVMDYNKMMLYSSTFYCVQLLRNQKEIQHFLQEQHDRAEMCYLLAYYIALELMFMIREAVQQDEKYQNSSYFLLHEQEVDYEQLESVMYSEQKLFVSILSQSYKHQKFQRCVQRAINKAYIHDARLKVEM